MIKAENFRKASPLAPAGDPELAQDPAPLQREPSPPPVLAPAGDSELTQGWLWNAPPLSIISGAIPSTSPHQNLAFTPPFFFSFHILYGVLYFRFKLKIIEFEINILKSSGGIYVGLFSLLKGKRMPELIFFRHPKSPV